MRTTEATANIFDDHRLFADSFSALIERVAIFDFVHTFDDDKELMTFLLKNPTLPIYLFLDFYLKDKNGLQFVNEIRQLNRKVKIIVISSMASSITVSNLMRYSSEGLVSKSSGFDVILQCLDNIHRDEQCLCHVSGEIVANTILK